MKEKSNFTNKIKTLSNIEYTDYPFITIYMNVNSEHFLEQQEKNRIFCKNSFEKALKKLGKDSSKEKMKNFQNDTKKIQKYINENINKNTHGIAIFACENLGIFEVFESVIPFENELIVNSFPHLKQLLYVYDEYEKTLVILLDSNHSEIFEINLGEYVSQKGEPQSGKLKAEIDNEVHSFHKQGGWSQLKYQNGVQHEKDWHYRETAEKATELFDNEIFDNIVILGINYEIENFKKYLPQRLFEKLIGTEPYNPEDNINTILEKIVTDLHKMEKSKEYDTVKEIIDKAGSRNGASIGVDETVDLATQGRIDTLVVVKENSIHGYRCGECLYSAKGQKKLGCPECNGASEDTDLIEELIRMTVKNGGRVEFLDKETAAALEIEKHSGVGAILRY